MPSARGSVQDTVRVFLKLGVVGFGGPAAHRRWEHTEGGRPRAGPLFMVFLKIGSVLYGSGYVLAG